MKDIWIMYNSSLTQSQFLWQYESFASGIRKNGYHPVIMSSSELMPAYGDDLKRRFDTLFAIFLDKDVNAALFLENNGVKVYNSYESIRICDDKALTYSKLYSAGVKIPPTIVAPKVFAGSVSTSVCKEAAERLGYPLIVKESYGSFGMQVYLAKNETELIKITESIGARPFVFQKYLKAAHGWDIRVVISGDRVLGAFKRMNSNDFRANIAAGGSMSKIELSKNEQDLVLKAAEATEVKFAGVDLLYDGDEFVVCEVNSNMHFKATQQIIDIDISEEIVKDLIVCCLNK